MKFQNDNIRRLTKEQFFQFINDIEGKDVKESIEIAKRAGIINPEYVRQIRTILGFAPPRGARITDEGREAIINDAESGMTVAEIAKKYKRSYFTIYNFIKDNKIESKPSYFEWSEIKIRMLINCYLKGWSIDDIAAKIGTTRQKAEAQIRHLKRKRCKKWLNIATKMGLYDKKRV